MNQISPPTPPCLCQRRALCQHCINRALLPIQERHREARERWETARRNCRILIPEENNNLNELQETSHRVRKRLECLNALTSSTALEVCAAAVANEQRQLPSEALEVQEVHQRLHAFQQISYQALEEANDSAQQQVQALRRQWALAAFRIHKIVVDPPVVKIDGVKQARGIGKIGGLPLPHAGPELFAVLPASELQSALRMVASSTCLVAKCLGIRLPHPILLRPTLQHDDIVEFGEDDEKVDLLNSISTKLSTSVALAAQKVTRSVFSTPTTGRLLNKNACYSSFTAPSMDPSKVQQRLRHSRAAILAESAAHSSTTYALEASVIEEEFATAWQLLQNNVVHLCIRAGVPVSDLWPAQAVLLNLHALYVYCKLEDDDSLDNVGETKIAS